MLRFNSNFKNDKLATTLAVYQCAVYHYRQNILVTQRLHDDRKLYFTNGTSSSEPESSTQLISSWKDLRCAGRGWPVTSCTASLTLQINVIPSPLHFNSTFSFVVISTFYAPAARTLRFHLVRPVVRPDICPVPTSTCPQGAPRWP